MPTRTARVSPRTLPSEFGDSSNERLILAAVAKRNVRRARVQGRAPEAAPPSPPARTALLQSRQFWLGVLAAACVLIPLAIVGVVLAGADDSPERAALSPTPTPDVAKQAEQMS